MLVVYFRVIVAPRQESEIASLFVPGEVFHIHGTVDCVSGRERPFHQRCSLHEPPVATQAHVLR